MTPCKPSSSNAEIVASVIRLAQFNARTQKRRYTHENGQHALAAYIDEHGIGAVRAARLAQAFEERGFTAYPHSAEHAMLEPEQAERHRKLADMRDAGVTRSAEFDALYAAEAEWLKANDIAYYPPLGWHYTR